ncbi:hypothetical protein L1049_000605 [Liquidambar formosana]|uniref:Expansin n=1 Tax=Liquidambar formosana TaxID=63359 RepID=A0AAP0NAS0_LIQFO
MKEYVMGKKTFFISLHCDSLSFDIYENANFTEDLDNHLSGGVCGYDDTFNAGFGVNTAAASGALFRGGEGCGACYQVMCNYRLHPKWCLRRGVVTITTTNFCPPNNNGRWCDPPHQHFDMSMPAFLRIARQGNEGIVPVLNKRLE